MTPDLQFSFVYFNKITVRTLRMVQASLEKQQVRVSAPMFFAVRCPTRKLSMCKAQTSGQKGRRTRAHSSAMCIIQVRIAYTFRVSGSVI